MKNTIIKIRPAGGLGQIGSNMTFIEYEEHRVLIDAGILFPYEDFFDIDYLIPDLSKFDIPDTLIITHGHEDHIGAIYNIIKLYPDIKIFAPRFAAALIRKKLEFNKSPFPVNVYSESDTFNFSDLTISPIQVNHSIPDTYGLFIKHDKSGTGIFFASDFKIDFKTKYERPFDFKKLKTLSADLKTKVFLADSTNILSSNQTTPSEFDLIPSFEKIISEAESRIFITLFSSNIHRIKTIVDLAEKYQFKVVPYGRSMISYIQSAKEEGVVELSEKVLKEADSTKNNEENIIVLLSGCQGDFLGTFRRVSMGEDSTFKLKSTDTFVLSSKAIPGNEKKISLLINKIAEANCKLFTPDDLLIHVSGHPGKLDLQKIYLEFKPTDIIPIHGEIHFLKEHLEYIKEAAPFAIGHFALNHDEIHIGPDGKIRIIQGEKCEPVIFHGKNIIIEREKISERRKMACNGVVFLSLKLDLHKNKIVSHTYDFLGVPKYIYEKEDHFKLFLLNEFNNQSLKDIEKFKENLRIAIRRYFDNQIGYKPLTTVHIL